MRVLHLVDSRQLRGGEIFASDLIRALSGADLIQRVAVLRDGSRERGVQYGVPEHVLGSSGRRIPGIRIRPRALMGLRALVGRWEPELVQTHGGDSLKYVMPAILGRPTMVVYRKIGLSRPDAIGGLRRVAHAQLMRRADRIVAVSEAVRRETVEGFHVPKDRVITIQNAVDPGRMKTFMGRKAMREALGVPLGSPVILSLGALTWEKDPIAHAEIADHVLRRRPEAVHLIVGEGPLRPQLEAAIRRRGLDGRVRLLQPRTDVAELLAMSDVMLLASRTEGMPACVIEAGMMGLPVAAYSVAGVPDVVVDGVSGRLSPPGDKERLAASVIDIIDDRELSRAMGAAARQRCLSRFDIATVAPQYLQLYEQLLAS